MSVHNRIPFEAPVNTEQRLWRYMDFAKFIDLIDSSELFFNRADRFEDIYECAVSVGTVEAEIAKLEELERMEGVKRSYSIRDMVVKKTKALKIGMQVSHAVNCWHMNDF